MSLGVNRDYKTADRRARTQLEKLETLKNRVQLARPAFTRERSYQIAMRILEDGRTRNRSAEDCQITDTDLDGIRNVRIG